MVQKARVLGNTFGPSTGGSFWLISLARKGFRCYLTVPRVLPAHEPCPIYVSEREKSRSSQLVYSQNFAVNARKAGVLQKNPKRMSNFTGSCRPVVAGRFAAVAP